MDRCPARWQQIASLYESAVDRDEAMREAFLDEACAGDEDLRCEVESLLRQDVSGVLLDRSLWATAASLLDDGFEVGPGTPLGPYRIESALGSGGMGEVFRAVDTRLDRTVAIKVLPTGDARDEQMRARFAREARAIAALTHPHICTLYDVGRHDEIDFIVMEYVEGDTLAERLAAGRLSLEEVLICAIQIASALEHAHGHGIVHRDLKPANVMLTAGGAKLLDFGLAKFRPIAGASLQEPVMTPGRANPAVGHGAAGRLEGNDGPLTEDGTIPGTVRYMAPEQIAGADVDARCDLFSFGAVVFEMLTGRRAFDGDSAATSGPLFSAMNRPPFPLCSRSRRRRSTPSCAAVLRKTRRTDGRPPETSSGRCSTLPSPSVRSLRPGERTSRSRAGRDGSAAPWSRRSSDLPCRSCPADASVGGMRCRQARFDPSRFCRWTTYPETRTRNTLPTG